MTWEITMSDDSLQPTDYNISSRRASDDLIPQAPKVRSSSRFLDCRASLAKTRKNTISCILRLALASYFPPK